MSSELTRCQIAPRARDSVSVTLPGPSRRIIVQPLETPAPAPEPVVEPAPEPTVEPERDPGPEREERPAEPVAP